MSDYMFSPPERLSLRRSIIRRIGQLAAGVVLAAIAITALHFAGVGP